MGILIPVKPVLYIGGKTKIPIPGRQFGVDSFLPHWLASASVVFLIDTAVFRFLGESPNWQ